MLTRRKNMFRWEINFIQFSLNLAAYFNIWINIWDDFILSIKCMPIVLQLPLSLNNAFSHKNIYISYQVCVHANIYICINTNWKSIYYYLYGYELFDIGNWSSSYTATTLHPYRTTKSWTHLWKHKLEYTLTLSCA